MFWRMWEFKYLLKVLTWLSLEVYIDVGMLGFVPFLLLSYTMTVSVYISTGNAQASFGTKVLSFVFLQTEFLLGREENLIVIFICISLGVSDVAHV